MQVAVLISILQTQTAFDRSPPTCTLQTRFALKGIGDNPVTCLGEQCSFTDNSTRVDCATTHCHCQRGCPGVGVPPRHMHRGAVACKCALLPRARLADFWLRRCRVLHCMPGLSVEQSQQRARTGALQTLQLPVSTHVYMSPFLGAIRRLAKHPGQRGGPAAVARLRSIHWAVHCGDPRFFFYLHRALHCIGVSALMVESWQHQRRPVLASVSKLVGRFFCAASRRRRMPACLPSALQAHKPLSHCQLQHQGMRLAAWIAPSEENSLDNALARDD